MKRSCTVPFVSTLCLGGEWSSSNMVRSDVSVAHLGTYQYDKPTVTCGYGGGSGGHGEQGDNCYLCEKCGERVTAQRRCAIKQLPSTLIVHLKRFEFDLSTMSRHKLNHRCSFPMELDMSPWTLETLEVAFARVCDLPGVVRSFADTKELSRCRLRARILPSGLCLGSCRDELARGCLLWVGFSGPRWCVLVDYFSGLREHCGMIFEARAGEWFCDATQSPTNWFRSLPQNDAAPDSPLDPLIFAEHSATRQPPIRWFRWHFRGCRSTGCCQRRDRSTRAPEKIGHSLSAYREGKR